MLRYDQSSAECLIFTYKEGLLAPIAHDLKLRVGKFSLSVKDKAEISASFDSASLEVVCAMENGLDKPNSLSNRDCGQIQDNIIRDVLKSKRFPDIRFQSSTLSEDEGDYRIAGDITICGVTRPMQFITRRQGNRYVAEVELHQPDFRIKPFRALMGTLKVAANLRVQISVPTQD